jgi:hypothetical protein
MLGHVSGVRVIDRELSSADELAIGKENLQASNVMMMDACREEAHSAVKGLNSSLISFEPMNIGVVGTPHIAYNTPPWQGRAAGPHFKVIFDTMIENVLKAYTRLHDSIAKLIIDFDNFVQLLEIQRDGTIDKRCRPAITKRLSATMPCLHVPTAYPKFFPWEMVHKGILCTFAIRRTALISSIERGLGAVSVARFRMAVHVTILTTQLRWELVADLQPPKTQKGPHSLEAPRR